MSSSLPTRGRDRPDVLVFAAIATIAQLADARMARDLPAGLNTAQFGVLGYFARNGGEATPAQLAAVFQVTKGAMTYTLQHMQAQGLVEIVPHGADGRKKLVSITPVGVAAHQQALVELRPQLERLRQAFGDNAFEAALPFLRALRAFLDETG